MLIFLTLIVSVVAAALTLLVKSDLRKIEMLAIVGTVMTSILLGVQVWATVGDIGIYELSWFYLDPFGALIFALIIVIGLAATLFSVGYLRAEMAKDIVQFGKIRTYYALLHLFIAAMILAVATTSPMVMWIAIEATTLSTAFLISFYEHPRSMEAAWKYLILNSVGLLLGFIGTLLMIAPAADVTKLSFVTWGDLLSTTPFFSPMAVKIAFIFVVVGFGTKVGWVPMHTWRPDTYTKAPAPVVALFSGVLLNVALLSVLRYKTVVDATLFSDFAGQILVAMGLLSVVVSVLIILGQKNYRRLLAYSSIEHAGLLAIGFGMGGLASLAAILHMIYHSLIKSLLFFVSGNIFIKYSSTKIYHIHDMVRKLPVTSAVAIFAILALVGLPPFGIFWSEWYLLTAVTSEHLWITVVILVSLAIAFVGFMKNFSSMLFHPSSQDLPRGEANLWTTIPLIVLMGVIVILSFWVPLPMQELIARSQDFLFAY